MLKVDKENCIGCGAWINDSTGHDITSWHNELIEDITETMNKHA